MIYTVYTSQNKLIFEDNELMEQFLNHLANRIMFKYGSGRNWSVTIEEVIIKPDNRGPVYKNNYIFTILLNLSGYNYALEKLPYGDYWL